MFFNAQNIINETTESELTGYSILIPKAYAREENNDRIRNVDDIKKMDHYELVVTRQIGSVQVRRNTYIYLKLSSRYVPIVLFMDGGVDFDKMHRKYVLREMDEIDRRVVLGFCRKFQSALFAACHRDEEESDKYWL